MNKTPELSRVRDALALALIANTEPYPETDPLNINPWLAMSLMQKAIRRNRRDLALAAARTLYDCSPERLWRRLSVIAFEDIGAADIDVVSGVLAGLKGKAWRRKVGGEWKVARHLVLLMCDAPKCRGADDLVMTCEYSSRYDYERQFYAAQSPSWLLNKVLEPCEVPQRAMALWYALGTSRFRSENLLHRRSDYEALLATLPDHGFDPLLVELTAEGLKKGGEILAAFVMLLGNMRTGGKEVLSDDRFPEELLIDGVPGWALDMHVREGNTAMREFLARDSQTGRWLAQYVPKAGRGKVFKNLVFCVESGLVERRFRWRVGDSLRDMADFECFGVAPQEAREAHDLMWRDIPLLNEMRLRVLQKEG